MLSKYLFLLAICDISSLYTTDWTQSPWQKTHYIWNFAISSSCDVGLIKSPVKYFEAEHAFNIMNYKNIKSGDIVWIRGRFVYDFYKLILPKIKNKFVLVISDGDESFPENSKLNSSEIKNFINNPKIIHIFAQNCVYNSSNKVSHLPIGLDLHTIAYKSPDGAWGEKGMPLEQEADLNNILNTLKPTYQRQQQQKAFVDFQLSDSMHGEHQRYLQCGEDRVAIFNRLLPTGLIDYAKDRMRRSDLWKIKGQYAFSISPHGNGLDCHRTWEDLILGCIVIVKTSPLDPLYKGLPVVIVKDWSEITQQNMNLWLDQYKDAFTNHIYRKKLTNSYWLNKIYLARKPYRNH